MTGILQIIGQSLWFILPAYVANAAPVIAGGGPPIDCGKKLPDGYRILGGGKTIRGFLFGLLAGLLIGTIQFLGWSVANWWLISILLSLGALLGDLFGSFIKRRVGLPRGTSAPGLDQLGFVAFALLLASPIKTPGWEVIVTLLLLTPLIHLGSNIIGYKSGLESEPY